MLCRSRLEHTKHQTKSRIFKRFLISQREIFIVNDFLNVCASLVKSIFKHLCWLNLRLNTIIIDNQQPAYEYSEIFDIHHSFCIVIFTKERNLKNILSANDAYDRSDTDASKICELNPFAKNQLCMSEINGGNIYERSINLPLTLRSHITHPYLLREQKSSSDIHEMWQLFISNHISRSSTSVGMKASVQIIRNENVFVFADNSLNCHFSLVLILPRTCTK